MTPEDLPPNMAAKVQVADDGCWLWTGALTGVGYASVMHERRVYNAHRLAYRLLVGEVPDGLFLDHLCRVTRCINPRHLEPVTHAENMRRAALQWVDVCRSGRHPRTADSTYTNPTTGKRQCRDCLREASQRNGERRRAQWAAYRERQRIKRLTEGVSA